MRRDEWYGVFQVTCLKHKESADLLFGVVDGTGVPGERY